MQFLYSLGLHNNSPPTGSGDININSTSLNAGDYPKITSENAKDVFTSDNWTISLMSTHDQYLYYYHPSKSAVITDKPSDFAEI